MATPRFIPSTIAILGGTGAEGGGLALRWARAGHRVIVGSRTAERAYEAAKRLSRLCNAPVEGMSNIAAARTATIVVLAVPYAAQTPTADDVKTALVGKILIDVTVPLIPPKEHHVQLPMSGSAVEALQKRLGRDVKVISAFQNVSAHQLADLGREVACDVLVVGDDEGSREAVVQLALDAGLRAWHAGPLANSAATEALTSLLIFINKHYKVERGSGIRITGIALTEGGGTCAS